jgi:hypothetical protein
VAGRRLVDPPQRIAWRGEVWRRCGEWPLEGDAPSAVGRSFPQRLRSVPSASAARRVARRATAGSRVRAAAASWPTSVPTSASVSRCGESGRTGRNVTRHLRGASACNCREKWLISWIGSRACHAPACCAVCTSFSGMEWPPAWRRLARCHAPAWRRKPGKTRRIGRKTWQRVTREHGPRATRRGQ